MPKLCLGDGPAIGGKLNARYSRFCVDFVAIIIFTVHCKTLLALLIKFLMLLYLLYKLKYPKKRPERESNVLKHFCR